MSFSVNDPFLYLLSAIIVVFVVAQSAFFLVKANRRAQQMGIAAATVRKTILSSALFSIAPAISILVGVITLSNFKMCIRDRCGRVRSRRDLWHGRDGGARGRCAGAWGRADRCLLYTSRCV